MRYFSDEQVCIDTVAKMRWPNGPSALLAATKSTTTSRLKSAGSAKSATSSLPSSWAPFLRILRSAWTSGLRLCGCWSTARTASVPMRSARTWESPRSPHGSCCIGYALLCRRLQRSAAPVPRSKWTKLSSAEKLGTCTKNAGRMKHYGGRRQSNRDGHLERGGKVHAKVVPTAKKDVLQGRIRKPSKRAACLYRRCNSYYGLNDEYVHQIINHLGEIRGWPSQHQRNRKLLVLLKARTEWNLHALSRSTCSVMWTSRYSVTTVVKIAAAKKMKDAERFNLALSQIAGKRLTSRRSLARWRKRRS